VRRLPDRPTALSSHQQRLSATNINLNAELSRERFDFGGSENPFDFQSEKINKTGPFQTASIWFD